MGRCWPLVFSTSFAEVEAPGFGGNRKSIPADLAVVAEGTDELDIESSRQLRICSARLGLQPARGGHYRSR